MSDVIGKCHSCELPIIEGESYHMYGGKTSHSNNQCVQRLKAELDALRVMARTNRHDERYYGSDYTAGMRATDHRKLVEAILSPDADNSKHSTKENERAE
jgi:hypothetical protein